MSILSIQDISKRYKFREVVKTITLEITSGEVVGLLGPNGAGKTTAFYMIVGLIPSDKGRILLDGQDLTALPMQRPDSTDPTYAEAGRLEYDLVKGIIEFSEQATITENGDQISSSYLVYNIKEQLINARSGGDGDPKVRIIYTPKEAVEADAGAGAEDTDAGSPEGSGEGGQ